jgi:radical SAM protein (TIGR01212 family)
MDKNVINEDELYRVYSSELKRMYGEKVYKIPINLPVTCPNRDGKVGTGGCIYCGSMGAGHESLESNISVKDQFEQNSAYIRKRYNAKKFITYFQNFSNTYMPIEQFKKFMKAGIQKDVLEMAISTRPDCISDEYLKYLKALSNENNVKITIELGLQTVNYKTLKIINRGHGLAEFIDAVYRIKSHGFKVCAHLIIDLPWDDIVDVIEAAKVLSALRVDYVKLHALYIVKNTRLAELYANEEVTLLTKEDYINRVIEFLMYLDKDIVLQRLIGRAPEKDTITANWNTSWWKIKDELLEKMIINGYRQGMKCNYLNGRALKDI